MPVLANNKRELFCRFLADPNITQAEAYALAGYTPSTSNASILANRPEVKQRVEEIREEKRDEEQKFKLRLKEAGLDLNSEEAEKQVREWSIDRVRDMLATNANMAQVVGDFKSAKDSIELIGKSMGMFDKDSKESGGNSSRPQVSIALVNQATGGASEGGGQFAIEGPNPLRPRLSVAGDAERIG